MSVYQVDPLADPRWPILLDRHPSAGVFHTRGWLETLRKVYRYDILAFTTCAPGDELTNAIPFCAVRSWATGRRLVSLPFSDHCQPMVNSPAEAAEILDFLRAERNGRGWRYIELRPLTLEGADEGEGGAFQKDLSFRMHFLDLTRDLESIFKNFHQNSIRQQISRAEREGLTYKTGGSESLLNDFYSLMLMTRRRHQIPPQPIDWFRVLLERLGDQAHVRVAYKDGAAISAIFTLFFRNSFVYKYGCSNPAFSNLGGTVSLVWQAIQDAKASGAKSFDLGRSDKTNEGLITFKRRWGAEASELVYYRCPGRRVLQDEQSLPARLAKATFSRLPDPLLVFAGKILYRHRG